MRRFILAVTLLAASAAGPVADAEASGPPELERAVDAVRSGRTTTAAVDLFDLLRSRQYPEEEVRLRTWLAVALDRQGLDQGARAHLRRAVRRGEPGDRDWARAVKKSLQIADRSADPTDLLASLRRIDLRDVPRASRRGVAWWRALEAWDAGDLEAARELLEYVGAEGPRGDRARYLLAVIDSVSGRPGPAQDAFRSLASAPESSPEVRELARLGLARIAYADGQYDVSARLYRGLPRLSASWVQGTSESAWALLRADGRQHLAMGQLVTLRSPYLQDAWLPETGLLEALAWYSVCDYRAMGAALDVLEAELLPMADAMAALRTRGGPELYVALYSADVAPPLAPPAYARLEADGRFAAAHGRVLRLQAERERLAGTRGDLRDGPLGRSLRRLLERERSRALERAGAAAARAVAQAEDEARRILAQGEGLRFESLVGQKDELMALQRDPDSGPEEAVHELVSISYATDPRRIYWPFAGEYWRDELGFYERVVHSSCDASSVR